VVTFTAIAGKNDHSVGSPGGFGPYLPVLRATPDGWLSLTPEQMHIDEERPRADHAAAQLLATAPPHLGPATAP
jgi:hypothetical protein